MEFFGNQDFYTFNGVKYVNTFPQAWSSNHMDGTGPEDCINCKTHGSLCGVFVMYCTNCAIHEYVGQRGLGAYFPATENTFMELLDVEENREILDFIKINGFVSASTSYLKNVPLECARYGHKMLDEFQKEIEEEEEGNRALLKILEEEDGNRALLKILEEGEDNPGLIKIWEAEENGDYEEDMPSLEDVEELEEEEEEEEDEVEEDFDW